MKICKKLQTFEANDNKSWKKMLVV